MSLPAAAGVVRPDLPVVDFDFDDMTWRRVGERFLDLAIDVSTGWQRRAPGATTIELQAIDWIRSPVGFPSGWRVEPRALSDPERLEQLQGRIIEELERRGIALISNAKLHDGRTALRACVVNFRTSLEDVESLVSASRDLGAELASSA